MAFVLWLTQDFLLRKKEKNSIPFRKPPSVFLQKWFSICEISNNFSITSIVFEFYEEKEESAFIYVHCIPHPPPKTKPILQPFCNAVNQNMQFNNYFGFKAGRNFWRMLVAEIFYLCFCLVIIFVNGMLIITGC